MRLLYALALALAGIGLSGCGAEESRSSRPVPAADTTPFVSLTEIESVLERSAGLELVRTGGGASVADDLDVILADATRYEEQSGAEFEVLVFPTPADARRATAQLSDETQRDRTGATDGPAAYIRAVNIVAAFPRPPHEVRAYERAWRAMRQLANACRESQYADRYVREACTDRPSDLELRPREPAPPGSAVTLDGVRYSVVLARELNPHISPDDGLMRAKTAGADHVFFGVFVRMCNERAARAPTARSILLTDALVGREIPPLEERAENAIGGWPTHLDAGKCAPASGSVAARAFDGVPIVFRIPVEMMDDRPLALRLSDTDGDFRLLQLDV